MSTVHNITNALYNIHVSCVTTLYCRRRRLSRDHSFYDLLSLFLRPRSLCAFLFFPRTGCVKFKYVPDIESIAVNVTYGKGNVQNGVIKGKLIISCPSNIILLLIIIYYHKIVDVQPRHVLPLRIIITSQPSSVTRRTRNRI